MKRITAILLTGVMIASVLSGCSSTSSESTSTSEASSVSSGTSTSEASSTSSSSSTESSSSSSSSSSDDEYEIITGDFTLDECVTLPDYKGVELTKTVYDVTEDYARQYVRSYMDTEEVTDADATVEDGDVVNIAYEGTIDGETFDGGSSDSYDLEIGSGLFIDGFEEGLIGLKAGEEIDLDLTFPDDYYETTLAGQAVSFHVTVNSISRYPELTDAWVEEYTSGEYTTVDDFVAYTLETLQESYESTSESDLYEDAWDAVYGEADFMKLPQEYIDNGEAAFDVLMELEATNYGYESAMDYLTAFGYSEEEAEEYMDSSRTSYGENYAMNIIFAEALLEAEGIDTDGDKVNEMYDTLEENYGMTLDELKETYTEAWVYLYGICSVVNEVIVDYATVTEETQTLEA